MFKCIKNSKRRKLINIIRIKQKVINSCKNEIFYINKGINKFYDSRDFDKEIEVMILLNKIDNLEVELSEYYYKLNKLKN